MAVLNVDAAESRGSVAVWLWPWPWPWPDMETVEDAVNVRRLWSENQPANFVTYLRVTLM